MDKYRFDQCTQAALESAVVPIGIYQIVNGRAAALAASDGLCELFGYKDRAEAIKNMDGSLCWGVHPDDAPLAAAAAARFIEKDEPYNLVCRVRTADGFRRVHIQGKRMAAQLAAVWFVDEGKTARDPAKAPHASAVYESILQALSEDYFDLYYVDVETGAYIEYGSRTEKGQRTEEKRGADFFTECGESARRLIYEEDLERFTAALNKEKLLSEIRKHGAFIYHYRLLINGVPNYVSMKAARIAGDDRHIIIGVSDVDTQVKDRAAAERMAEEKKSYLRLSALNGNLMVLYYVDLETNAFSEFTASAEFKSLGIARQGNDFFKTAHENSLKTIYPEDQALVQSKVTKENILAAIQQDGIFMLDYRMMSGGHPIYVRMKAAKIEEDGKALLIIGVLDEDAQIRQAQAYARDLSAARKMATVDSLTGVKNKHAYAEWEEKINRAIKNGEQDPFAVVVCDINSLKAVNDLYGHNEGDACIKKACMKICHIFSHSPVFRVGGDEFVVLLSGSDYHQRAMLMEMVNAIPKDRSQIKLGETISAGMVEYRKGQHASLQSMAEEADKAMYLEKRAKKKHRS